MSIYKLCSPHSPPPCLFKLRGCLILFSGLCLAAEGQTAQSTAWFSLSLSAKGMWQHLQLSTLMKRDPHNMLVSSKLGSEIGPHPKGRKQQLSR